MSLQLHFYCYSEGFSRLPSLVRSWSCLRSRNFICCYFLKADEISRLLWKCSEGSRIRPQPRRCRLTKAVLINLSRRSPLTDLAEALPLSPKQAASVTNLPHTWCWVCVCDMKKRWCFLLIASTHTHSVRHSLCDRVKVSCLTLSHVSHCAIWKLKAHTETQGTLQRMTGRFTNSERVPEWHHASACVPMLPFQTRSCVGRKYAPNVGLSWSSNVRAS